MSYSPQLENGYTRIANELLDALVKIRIPGEQMQCLLYILRRTYGFKKKEAVITTPEFVEATGLTRQHVYRSLKSLKEKNIIGTNNGSKNRITYRINKIFLDWKQIKKGTNNGSKNTLNICNKKENINFGTNNGSEPIMVPNGTNNGSVGTNNGSDILIKENLKKKDTAFCNAVDKNAVKEKAVDEHDFYPTKKDRKLSGKRLEAFNKFWAAFDLKKGKAEAADAWLDIPSLTDPLVDQIVKAATMEAKNRLDLIKRGQSPKWAQGWLSGRRWEDEPEKPFNHSSKTPKFTTMEDIYGDVVTT